MLFVDLEDEYIKKERDIACLEKVGEILTKELAPDDPVISNYAIVLARLGEQYMYCYYEYEQTVRYFEKDKYSSTFVGEPKSTSEIIQATGRAHDIAINNMLYKIMEKNPKVKEKLYDKKSINELLLLALEILENSAELICKDSELLNAYDMMLSRLKNNSVVETKARLYDLNDKLKNDPKITYTRRSYEWEIETIKAKSQELDKKYYAMQDTIRELKEMKK